MANTSKKYGIKAYGSWDRFSTRAEFKKYLEEWIANTDGSEQDRAYLALGNLASGINETDTDL
jgi:hypothetical protein